jgi:uncharacterized protein YraI
MTRSRFVFSMVLLVSLLAPGAVPGLAQDDAEDCAAFLDAVSMELDALYADLAAGQARYISAAADAPDEVTLMASTFTELDTDTMQIGAVPDTLDLALFRPVEGVTAALLGGAMTDVAAPASETASTVTVTSTANPNLNLREGPSADYPVLAVLSLGESAVADGRNEAGDWLRLRREDLTVWGFAEYLESEDDIEALPVLADDDRSRPDLYSAPFQAFTLITGDGCAGSGVLVQRINAAEDAEPSYLRVNGVGLAFTDATFLLSASAEDALDVTVLAGSVRISAPGSEPLTAEAGALASVEPGMPLAEAGRFPLYTVPIMPLSLLPAIDVLACMIGLPVDVEPVTMHAGPGADYVRLTDSLTADSNYVTTGYAADDGGALWWQLDVPGRDQAWVPQDGTFTLGLCADIAEVEAPVVVAPAPATGGDASGGGGDASGGSDAGGDTGGEQPAASSSLVPAGQTVWQSYPGTDNLSGTCNTPPIPLCDHLVAIVNNGDGTISWRGQEPTPYTLIPTGSNTFVYNGRRMQNDGTLSMNLTFTSASTWSMTMVVVYDSDAACQHTFYYTADFQW